MVDDVQTRPSAREELREALIAAATRAIDERGVASVRARDLAAEVGCAVGSIYNVFPDIDALILAVKAETLDKLEAEVRTRLGEFAPGTPLEARARFVALARVYLGFAHENWRLWSAAFEHASPDTPAYRSYMERLDAILVNIENPLGALLPSLDSGERRLVARGLFGAVHGMVTLGLNQKLGEISLDQLGWQIETVFTATLDGLMANAKF
jgi:AcrR family transcriptional regulator